MDVIQYPNSVFKLHRPFPPAGDQPTAIKGLLEGLEDGLSSQTLLGVTGSGKTYTMILTTNLYALSLLYFLIHDCFT